MSQNTVFTMYKVLKLSMKSKCHLELDMGLLYEIWGTKFLPDKFQALNLITKHVVIPHTARNLPLETCTLSKNPRHSIQKS